MNRHMYPLVYRPLQSTFSFHIKGPAQSTVELKKGSAGVVLLMDKSPMRYCVYRGFILERPIPLRNNF